MKRIILLILLLCQAPLVSFGFEQAQPVQHDVQTPLATNGDSVYVKDIKNSLSDAGTFAGANLTTLFDNLDTSITDSSETNPKWFKFYLERPARVGSIAVVAKTGNFSNVKFTLLDRQGTVIYPFDNSTVDTKYTSHNYDIPDAKNVCCVLMEFYTADPVTVSFLYIRKILTSSAILTGTLNDGSFANVPLDEEGNLRVNSFPYTYGIAEGSVPGHTTLLKFGTINALATTLSTIWEGPTPIYVYLTSAEQLKITSTDNVNDNVDGTGALTLTLFGLDTNWAEISETVTMTGTTAVTTTKSFIRVFRAYVATSGSSRTNTGTISIKNNAESVTQAIINVGDSQTLMALWTVPAGKVAYLVQGTVSSDDNKPGRVSFKTRLNDGGTTYPWLIKYRAYIFGGNEVFPFTIPFQIPAKTDIEAQIYGGSAAHFGATFELWYEDI